jgi:tetratricopeptide (TPR) repeat protein
VSDAIGETRGDAEDAAPGEIEPVRERDRDSEAPRRRVGPFTIVQKLGGGGMGVVYEGIADDGRRAAVKVLRAALASDEAVRRFAREATLRFEHPNIVKVLDAGADTEGTPYIAFERLEGETLEARLAIGALPPKVALDFAVQTAAGLAAAHAEGIVHRDLKPANLFVTKAQVVKILDFGIARVAGRDTHLTATGTVVGTPSYLSPEQAQGDPRVDARTDVWALGVVLHEMLAGRAPFDRDTALATMLAVLMEQPPPLTMLVPGIPRALADLVEKCLAKRREDRFASASELGAALRTIDLTALGTPAASELGGTQTSLEAVGRTISPGEQRLVTLLLAEGVRDRGIVERAIVERGGVLLAAGGPKRAVGLFGGERSEGDEVERATQAAVASRAAVASLSVASGRASYSGSTGIAGSVLRTAEAGCAMQLGGIALDTETARALRGERTADLREIGGGFFEWREPANVGLPSMTPIAAAHPTLGREIELSQLRITLDTSREERRSVGALVLGPPGIGKSRLVAEARRALAVEQTSTRVLAGRAEPLRGDVALSLMASMLAARAREGAETDGWPRLVGDADAAERRAAVRALARDAFGSDEAGVASAEFLGELLGVPMADNPANSGPGLAAARRDPRLMLDRLRLALVDWLEAQANAGPVVLVLEDLQWADAASLELVDEVLGLLGDLPFCVIATGRPELLELRPELFNSAEVLRVEPRPLSAAHVGALARTIAGRELPAPLVATLAERTAGNPLFVEQIVLALRDEGRLSESSARELDDLPLPLTVEAAVQSRLDHLPAQEKDLCKRAAVLGRPFGAAEVESLGAVRADLLLASLARRDLVMRRTRGRSTGGREYQFRSRLVADVAYRMIADPVRVELHRRAAAFLASTGGADAEEIARHHELGGEPERAAERYARAAIAAARFGDSQTVLRCADRAVALGVLADLHFALHMARAECYELLARLDEQRVSLASALEVARTPAERARVLADQAVWLWRTGVSDRAELVAAEAVAAARDGNDLETLAMARGRQAAVLTYLGKLDPARTALREAEALAESAAPRVRSLAAGWRAQLASALGDLGERRDAFRHAGELYTAEGDLRRAAGAEMNLADASNRVGGYAEAEHALRDALEKCRRLGYRLMEGYALANLGYALTMLNRPEEALAALDEAGALAERAKETRLGVSVRAYRARALLRGGRAKEALREARETAMLAEASDLGSVAVLAHTLASEASLSMGQTDAALAAATRALALRDELGSVEEDEAEVFLAYARALEAQGRLDEAQEARLRGRSRVQYIARRIADPELRERFLRDVAANRALAGGALT